MKQTSESFQGGSFNCIFILFVFSVDLLADNKIDSLHKSQRTAKLLNMSNILMKVILLVLFDS